MRRLGSCFAAALIQLFLHNRSPDPGWPHVPVNTIVIEPDRKIEAADPNELAVNITVARLGLQVDARADLKERHGGRHQLVSLAACSRSYSRLPGA